jgi:hypothetical protein
VTVLSKATSLAYVQHDSELRPEHVLAAIEAQDGIARRTGRLLPASPETTMAIQYAVQSAGSASKVTVTHLRAVFSQGLPESSRAVLLNARRFACKARDREIRADHLIAALDAKGTVTISRERFCGSTDICCLC